jgi:anti-sigma regulatory factor (Ser/Thr protein kinase)
MHAEHTLRFAGTERGFADAVTALRAILDARDLHPRHRHDIELVFDEVATNIVRHGRPAGAVEVAIRFGDPTTLVFEDDGVAFDPRTQPAPPAVKRRADLRIGGLGLVLVRDRCAQLDYVRTAGQRNRLTLSIPVPAGDDGDGATPAPTSREGRRASPSSRTRARRRGSRPR